MQRVKAFELRQKDEKGLVEELTKFRVSFLSPRPSNSPPSIERARPAESQQGFSSPPGQARPH